MAYSRFEVDFGIWGTLRKIALLLIVVAVMGCMILWYIPVLKQANALEKEIEVKRQNLKKQQEMHQKYSDEILELKSDPEAVERAAREILKKAKPNETIYHFEASQQEK